jgi:signal transduction histidine kinase
VSSGYHPAVSSLFLAVLALLAPPTGPAASPEVPAPRPGRIVYGGDAAFAPYEWLDHAGQPKGFNVELVKALARGAGLEVEFRLAPWARTLAAFEAGSVDLVSMAQSEERAQRYDLLAQTWTLEQVLLFLPGRADHPRSLDQLASESVAVERRALLHDMLLSLPELRRPVLIPVPDQSEALRALLAKRASAVAGNAQSLRVSAAEQGVTGLQEVPVKALAYFLATQRGRRAQFGWVPDGLEKLRETGEFQRLVEHHLVLPAPARGWREVLPVVAGAGAGVALVALVAVLWNRSLRLQVRRRTEELSQSTARLQAANAELEAKNAELERFTYTVSHDLRSPLVTILGFLGFAQKALGSGDALRAQADLGRVRSAAGKMEHLLREVLELSRIGRVAAPSQAVSFEALAREAVALAHSAITARGVEVHVDEGLPTVLGDPVRVREMLQNLLENAARFAGDQRRPVVTIGSRGTAPDGHCVLFVRDNGMGVEPRHHSRIFDLFEKLDPGTEGTGVGLAIVKRIVEVHGGRIWVESGGRGQGSTFCFTLPAAAPPLAP